MIVLYYICVVPLCCNLEVCLTLELNFKHCNVGKCE